MTAAPEAAANYATANNLVELEIVGALPGQQEVTYDYPPDLTTAPTTGPMAAARAAAAQAPRFGALTPTAWT